jgi:Fur family transcriptional regulator, ferric uptake regulator
MALKSRNTKQKELIQKEIEKINDFFTVEELYIGMQKKNKDIGLATIYRYLKQLRKEKLIHSYTCESKLIYSKNKKSHCHFTCEETGKVTHFEVDSLDFLKNKIPGTISSFQIEVKGKCKDCSKS